MKKLITLLLLGIISNTYAQYYQRYYNLDFTTPQYRDEIFNSGIKTVLNFKTQKKNYYSVGIGTSYNNTALPNPNNKSDRLRFVKNKKDGSTVINNYGYDFDDPLVAGFKQFHSHGNSIAEIDNGSGTGGFIAVGNVTSNSITGATAVGGSDVLYTRIDSNGVMVSAERIDFMEGKDIAWCVRRSRFIPGTFLICGESAAVSGSYTNCIVARLDATGGIIWSFLYNFDPTPTPTISAHCRARQLCEDPTTGNIYVVGTLQDILPVADVDGLAFGLTSAGGVIWAHTYNLASDDEFKADRFTSDGNIIVGGHSNFTATGAAMTNMLLTKLKAADGTIIFQTLLRATGATTAITYDSKCFDVIEGTPLTGTVAPSYYLVGPVFRPDGTFQLMYKTNGGGLGVNNYQYNKMKIDSLFGIDLETTGSKGVLVASSILDPASGFSDAHFLKTYSNGATCKDYCPKNPPLNIAIQMQQPERNHFIQQQANKQPLDAKRINYASVLQCNQVTIPCGAVDKQIADQKLSPGIESKNILYPNPVKGLLYLDLSGVQKGKYSLVISDATGKAMLTKQIEIAVEKTIIQIDVSHLHAGMYLLQVKGNTEMAPLRFIKE